MADTTRNPITIKVEMTIEWQQLADTLSTAIEGGSNYWASFKGAQRSEGTDWSYLSVEVIELDASTEGKPRFRRRVTVEDLAKGIKRMAESKHAWIHRHLADFINENDDATTADVILQMTVFGDVIYG